MERAFGSGAHNGWWNNPRIAERLKLTDDQRKAMDGIMLEHREKLIDLQANPMTPLSLPRSTRSYRRGAIWRGRMRAFFLPCATS
jgi:hypothetical protein